jgi:hypothetical protein
MQIRAKQRILEDVTFEYQNGICASSAIPGNLPLNEVIEMKYLQFTKQMKVEEARDKISQFKEI